MTHIRRAPTGYVATCQCGGVIGAIDIIRASKELVGKTMGSWVARGCTLTPRFESTWEHQLTGCTCVVGVINPEVETV